MRKDPSRSRSRALVVVVDDENSISIAKTIETNHEESDCYSKVGDELASMSNEEMNEGEGEQEREERERILLDRHSIGKWNWTRMDFVVWCR